jgi:hypothetical protein
LWTKVLKNTSSIPRNSSSQVRNTRRKLQERQVVSWNVDTVHALNTQNLSLFVLPKQGVQNFGRSWRRINGDFLKLLCCQYDYDIQDMRSKRREEAKQPSPSLISESGLKTRFAAATRTKLSLESRSITWTKLNVGSRSKSERPELLKKQK